MLIKPKKKFWMPSVAPLYAAAGGGGGGPVFTYAGTDSTNTGYATFISGPGGYGTNNNINIGAATSDRFVIVATADANGYAISSLTVNGVALNQDVTTPTGDAATQIFSGLVGTAGGAGIATITVNYASGAGYTNRYIDVWTGTGLASNVFKHTATLAGASSTTIPVNAGDFLVAVQPNAGYDFSTSTETPVTRSDNALGGSPDLVSGEWNTIISTNAAFTVQTTHTMNASIASYR
jgi:hypothetical protein